MNADERRFIGEGVENYAPAFWTAAVLCRFRKREKRIAHRKPRPPRRVCLPLRRRGGDWTGCQARSCFPPLRPGTLSRIHKSAFALTNAVRATKAVILSVVLEAKDLASVLESRFCVKGKCAALASPRNRGFAIAEYPGGMPACSRWLSEERATPPASTGDNCLYSKLRRTCALPGPVQLLRTGANKLALMGQRPWRRSVGLKICVHLRLSADKLFLRER